MPTKPIPTDLHKSKRRSDALDLYITLLEDLSDASIDASMPNAPAIKALLELERVYVKSVHRQAFSVLLSCLRAAASRERDLAMDATVDFTERSRGTCFGIFGTIVVQRELHAGHGLPRLPKHVQRIQVFVFGLRHNRTKARVGKIEVQGDKR